MIPRAKVSGKLFIPGKGDVPVKGAGYHEQGHANAPFQDVFSYWYWTRFFIDDWTFIFPVAQAPGHALNVNMRALLIYHKNKPVADIFDISGLYLGHEVHEYQTDVQSGQDDIPKQVLFRARQKGLNIRVRMKLNHELERFAFRPFSRETPRQPLWFQHLMSVNVEGKYQNKPLRLEGHGVFETMLTGLAIV